MSEAWKRLDGTRVTGVDKYGQRYPRPATKHEQKYLREWGTNKSKADRQKALEESE